MNKNSLKFLVPAFVLLFAITGGGCGGGSGSVGTKAQVSTTPVVIDESIFDTDLDGVPNILDFDEVDQNYYGENDSHEGIEISSIPSRHHIKNLKKGDEVSFVVDLTAGNEYTVEISDSAGISGTTEVASYAFPIGDNIPEVQITNPQGTELQFLDFGRYDDNYDASKVIDLKNDVIELSMYPRDNPYMICYTFTPSVTGSYTINFKLASNDIVSTDTEAVSVESASDETAFEHVSTLFIYKELRDGNAATNEAGQYKRYIFKDLEGNLSNTISMNDIMALRIAYYKRVYDVLTHYESDVDRDSDKQEKAYFECLQSIKPRYGLFTSEDLDGTKQKSEAIYGGTVDKNDESDDDDDDATVTTAAASAISPAAINVGGTEIQDELYGMPYDETKYRLGTGYFGITGVKAPSRALKTFKLNTPAKKKVISSYTASFISSQEDRENISKTVTGASIAIGGFGLGGSYSSESKIKFGLTSTTFVVHYEEVETGYRMLEDEEYELKTRPLEIANKDMREFRNKYGDYFVGGYKYGGTYDAFITITTQTMEQLEEVKTKLSVNFSSSSFAGSADVESSTKDTLNKNQATVKIDIKTAGIDTSNLPAIKTGTSNNISDVISGLAAFKTALQNSKVEDFEPVYVMMKRYSLLESIDKAMDEQGDTRRVPFTPAHSQKILSFNSKKMIMDSYYNVIGDLDSKKMDSEVKNKYKEEYEKINNEIAVDTKAFYAEENSAAMEKLQQTIENLSGRLKAVGDRYVFYQMLIAQQKKEINCANNSVTSKPFGDGGGSIGIRKFDVSTAVASDIAAGKHDFGEVLDKNARFIGLTVEWRPSYTATLPNGDTNAVFCYINVIANNKYDNNRDVTNSPCIGTNRASFYFQSGGTRRGEWETKLWSMRFDRTLYPFGGLQ